MERAQRVWQLGLDVAMSLARIAFPIFAGGAESFSGLNELERRNELGIWPSRMGCEGGRRGERLTTSLTMSCRTSRPSLEEAMANKAKTVKKEAAITASTDESFVVGWIQDAW